MNIQRKLGNGNWDEQGMGEFADSYIDQVLAREPMQANWFKREPLTDRAAALAYLATGETLKWDDEWYAELRDADAAKWQPKPRPAQTMARCECGHDVPTGTTMSSSHGTCCPDCYDQMSD